MFGAAKQFYLRHRTLVAAAVLSSAGIVTGTAIVLSLMQAPVLGVLTGALALLLSAILAGIICLWQSRHLGLAILTAAAPLPGLIWAAPLSAGSAFGLVPFLAYGFGFSAAALYTHGVLTRVLRTGRFMRPWRAAALATLVLALVTLIGFRQTALADAGLQVCADMFAALTSVGLLLPKAVSVLEFDEAFVVRANRTRESRGRQLHWLGSAAVPRWGFSFTGIGFVLAALGWFGAGAKLDPTVTVAGGLVIAAGAWCGGGWRDGVALGFAVAVAALLLRWGGMEPVGILQGIGLVLTLALYSAQQVRELCQSGAWPEDARGGVLEDGGGLVIACLGSLAALFPAFLLLSGVTQGVLGVVVASGASLLLAPAAVTALEGLWPRRRTVEELYGRRKSLS